MEGAVTASYHRRSVGHVDVFYRQAGPRDAPTILLLHGYPTSSHMFRGLIPQLEDGFYLVAPALPGFGQTKAPPRGKFDYTFDNLAAVVDQFVTAIGLKQYVIYIFDYGAPTGLRLAAAHPEQVTALISQNGNAYEEELGPMWALFRQCWQQPTPEHRDACRVTLTPEATRNQYATGATPERLSPDGYELDIAYLARPGADDIQLDFIYDYRTNVASYPNWQAYLREQRPPTLVVWGKNDPFSFRLGPRPSRVTNRTQRCCWSMRATLRSKRTRPRSLRKSAASSTATHPREHAIGVLLKLHFGRA
jgi:pimeloyl-ACP methyl ester carboxylesterase